MHMQTYFHQNCPYCNQALRIVIELLGREVACDHCRQRFTAQDESGQTSQENLEPSLLIVESDRKRLGDLTRRFAQQGYAVIGVHHPRMALAAANSREFGVAVVDVDLPEMDGEELMGKLLRRVNGLHVVLLTHPNERQANERQESHGGHGDQTGKIIRVDKPCSLERLGEAVEDAIHESRVTRHFPVQASMASSEHSIPR